MTLGRATYEPGWKWSEHVGAAPDDRCMVEHLGLVVSGRAAVAGPDYEAVMSPGDIFAVPPDHDSWVVGDEPYVSLHFLGAVGLRRRVARRDVRPLRQAWAGAGEVQDRGGRPAQHPLRRGRPGPAPLQRHPRADRGDREGGAAAALALRRPAGAVLPARPRPPRGARRAADGDRGAHGRRAPEPARRRRRRSAPRRAPATRSCGCSTPRSRTRPPTTCSAATSRSSTAPSRSTATAAPTAPPGSRPRSPSGSSWRSPPASRPSWPRARAAARATGWPASRAPPAGSSAAPASAAGSRSPARRTGSWSRRSGGRSPRRPSAATARCARPSARSRETLEHHAHVQLRAAA